MIVLQRPNEVIAERSTVLGDGVGGRPGGGVLHLVFQSTSGACVSLAYNLIILSVKY